MSEKIDPEAPEYLNATQLNRRMQLVHPIGCNIQLKFHS